MRLNIDCHKSKVYDSEEMCIRDKLAGAVGQNR